MNDEMDVCSMNAAKRVQLKILGEVILPSRVRTLLKAIRSALEAGCGQGKAVRIANDEIR